MKIEKRTLTNGMSSWLKQKSNQLTVSSSTIQRLDPDVCQKLRKKNKLLRNY